MVKCFTKNIEVRVSPSYHFQASNPELAHFVHIYEVTIINHSDKVVQLISREWYIRDLIGSTEIIKGNGVIGQQPIIEPTQSHTYASGCNFKSDYGFMEGYYNFKRLQDQTYFKVKIPRFQLVFPPKLS
ncbi:MAG: Co2+/Mg2+ efflux protein ApaG [Bacteroidia bacterium]